MAGNRGIALTRGEPETAPPSYTEQVDLDQGGSPKIKEEQLSPEPERAQQTRSEGSGEATRVEPMSGGEESRGLDDPNLVRGTITNAPGLAEHTDTSENAVAVRQNELQRVQVTLDPEIAETIRRMAREQQSIRTEIESSRRETFEIRVLVKTHESRLNRMFQRVGDIIEDQWGLRAGIDELKTLRGAVGARGQGSNPVETPIKSEPVSPDLAVQPVVSPEPFVVTVSDIESLYATDEKPVARGTPESQERRGTVEQPVVVERREVPITPGEAWIQNRNGQRRRGLGTEEVLQRWRAASEESRERRARKRGVRDTPQQQGPGNRDIRNQTPAEGQQRRSVTQPHEVGFGRGPNHTTPSGNDQSDGHRGRQPPGGGSSGSSDDSRRGGGEPNRRSDHGSRRPRRRSRGGSRDPGRRRGQLSHSSSPDSDPSDDWDSEFTILDDEGRRQREKKECRRDPKTEYEREQLRGIREQIRKMVGQEIQYAATYKGVKDIVTIIKYSGQNDNRIFTKWLDHLLMYFQLNRMCGPDNELVRLSAMYNSLDGVAEEWYRDLILHTPRRSWTFEKAVCSLFLTYVFGSAASHAAREFGEVRYSRTEGAREYAQRLKTKARHLARKPDESTMIVRFLAGLPNELSQRLTLWEWLDPARDRFKHFVAKLHELEEAENVTRTVSAAVVDEQRKTGTQGLRRPNRPQFGGRNLPHEPQRAPAHQQGARQPVERRPEDRPARGKGPSPNVTCFRCQGKGHYASDPACPMFGKDGGPGRQLRDRPQLKAARVPETDGEVGTSGDLLEGASDTGDWENGSQWESQTEGEESIHSHDEAPRVNRISVADILSESEGDDVAYVRAVRAKVVSSPENPSRAAMHPKIDRPRRSKAYESCLAAYVEINGMDAFTLFDSGSSADTISPDFARVGDVRVHTLDKPVPLQLGTVGSRASINYGTWTSIALGGRKEDRYYLDVVNIDRYDAILGAPFMRKFGIRLDFASNSIVVGDAAIEALLPEEEAALLKGRETRRRDGERGWQN